MGAFALPLLVGATVVGGAIQAKAAYDSGKFQESMYKEQAKAEKDALKQREIERKRRLINALSLQTVHSAKGNIDPGSGSRLAITKSDVQQAQLDSFADQYRTSRSRNLLIAQGGAARRAGTYGAIGSLADTTATVTKLYG